VIVKRRKGPTWTREAIPSLARELKSPRWQTRDSSFAGTEPARFPDKSGNRRAPGIGDPIEF